MAATDASDGVSEVPARIDSRYEVLGVLGEGGLAVVYRVRDALRGTDKALKRLTKRAEASSWARCVELFEREYHTLAQLAHPRTVAVCDYGSDDGLPYYTMELLDGGDLREGAPVEWRRACALARDVCSALSLIHSRRLVHRDLSPRNVRCTPDGQAKLIDFGAVVPMGPCRHAVGTAVVSPPEVVNLQPLDGRTDLYSLGATLYYTLTGHHAYPARTFRALHELWRTRVPPRPSALVPGIPEALDDLVMSLIQLDPAHRPVSAAEVMERLAAIADLPGDESLLVPQAYLAAPTLVGREKVLTRVLAGLARATEGGGGAFSIRGGGGLGRSRLLDAAALSATLGGVLTLRADADDGRAGDYGVVRSLASQLLDLLPDTARATAKRDLPVLGHVLPELLEGADDAESSRDDLQLRHRLQAALRAWIEAVARERPLLLAVDDVDRVDEPSQAFVALMARAAPGMPVLVLTSASTEPGASQALAMLADASEALDLEPLDGEQTRELLASVFGDAANVDLLAERLHALAKGNPRDVMRLAQHLVDRGVVRYAAGAWSLPSQIDASDLPASLSQAFAAAVASLDDEAVRVAQALALSPDERFTFDECSTLAGHPPAGTLVGLLDRLVTADVVRRAGELYGLAQHGWVAALSSVLSSESERALHLRLAQVFQHRRSRVRLMQHLLRAGEQEQALDALVNDAETSQMLADPTSDSFVKVVAALPSGWVECYDQALRLCEELGRPRSQAFFLRSRLSGLVSVTGIADTSQLARLLEELAEDSGLAAYLAQDPSLDAGERLKRAFEEAQRRHGARPEGDRGMDPFKAVRQLARTLIQISAVTVTTRNLRFFDSLPSLEPFVPLSPALQVVHQLVCAVGCRLTGQNEETRRIYRAIIERTSQPDRAGLDESHHRHGTFGVRFGMGMLDAAMGLKSSLAWAAQIQDNPLYQVNAWTVRMLYHLWQGDTREADHYRRRAEVTRVQNSRYQFFEGGHLAIELTACASSGDLMGVKRCIEAIEPRAEVYEGWVPILRHARGEYHRLRGDHDQALEELDASLGDAVGSAHEVWPDAAAARVRVLAKLGRHAEAIDAGTRYLSLLPAAAFGCSSHTLRGALAVALATAGNQAEAIAHADVALDGMRQLGARGLRLAAAYRARAQVARIGGDLADAEAQASLCKGVFPPSADPRVVARLAPLPRKRASSTLPDGEGAATGGSSQVSSIVSASMEACHTVEERARCSLDLLARSSGVQRGVLYYLDEAGQPVLAARLGVDELPVAVDRMAREVLLASPARNLETRTVTEAATDWVGADGQRFHLVPLCSADDHEAVVTALGVLVSERDQPFLYPSQVAFELGKLSLLTSA